MKKERAENMGLVLVDQPLVNRIGVIELVRVNREKYPKAKIAVVKDSGQFFMYADDVYFAYVLQETLRGAESWYMDTLTTIYREFEARMKHAKDKFENHLATRRNVSIILDKAGKASDAYIAHICEQQEDCDA
jgi:hypothetical protein